MKLDNSILKDVREAVGLTSDSTDFDIELLQHINVSIAKLKQAGVGTGTMVSDETSVWADVKDTLQVKGNEFFQMIPLYITLSTKVLFDPPTANASSNYIENANELLWRLKIFYE